MNNDDQTETACELFEQYAALLNQEFHDHTETEKNGQECISIATQLLKLGFVVLANVPCNMETVTISDDTTQTVLTFTYELTLVPNQNSIQQPIAFASAVSRVFGSVTAQVRRDHTRPIISSQDETWLHSILDNLGADSSDKDSLYEGKD